MSNHDTEETEEHRSTTSDRTRRALLASGAAAIAATAGCLGGNDDDGDTGNETQQPEVIDSDEAPTNARVEDPPGVVYKPAHVDAVEMLGTVHAGDFALLPHYTYPHQFWLMRGGEQEVVSPITDGLHLMLAFWDRQSGKILPVDAGQRIEIRRDGQRVEPPFQPWPMISQRMGFHFGDNVPFPAEGTYTIDVQMGPINARKTGSFDGRFDDTVSTSFELEFSQQRREQVLNGGSFLDESEWGEPGAVPMMGEGGGDGSDGGMDMSMVPDMSLPPAAEYPGRDLGTHTSDDAVFVVRYLENSRLANGEGYLFLSARTPHNRVPLPEMAISVEGDVEGSLTQTLDSDLGHHYGLPATLSAGDSFEVVISSPPQVARHRGYETAFLEMDPISVEVPE